MTQNSSAINLPPPTFDLDVWASNYDGILLPLRLAHVAVRCPALAQQSLTLAIDVAKSGKDVQLYTRLCDLAASLGFKELGVVDGQWVSRQDEGNRRELSRLEGELRGYKNNLIRESIRMGQEDLATHLLLTGGPVPDLTNPQTLSSAGYAAAYQAYGKVRDYCTTPTHLNGMMLRLVYTGILQAVAALQSGAASGTHWSSVMVNAGRLRSAGVKEEEQVKLTPIAHVATGITHMACEQYADAASAFLQTPFDYQQLTGVHGTDFPRAVASANDVAIYGGLCALATMSREALIHDLLGGPFRQFLELEPQMRKAITLYTTAKYSACLTLLQHYHSDWSLDLFLGSSTTPGSSSHVDRLFARIRERSITAYFSAFSQVSLAALADTFPTISATTNATTTNTATDPPPPTATTAATAPTAELMEAEVLGMIQRGTLDARLDTVRGVLIAPHNEARHAAHTDARKTAEEIERTLLLRLHKVNMVLASLEIPREKPEVEAPRSRTGYPAVW